MNMVTVSDRLRSLNEGEMISVYTSSNGTVISATRTDKICPHDFVVGLEIPSNPIFYPTHIRLLFDLYLKKISGRPDEVKNLFIAFEKLSQGEDPTTLIKDIQLKYPMELDDFDTNLYYAQLLMIEQDFNYGPNGCKTSNLEIPHEMLMRFIRQIYYATTNIDKIIFSAVRGYMPPSRFGVPIEM